MNVSVQEEGLIQQKILQVYDSRNMFYPSGICKRCIYDLSKINNGEVVQLKLPDNYLCQIGRHTRSSGDEPCMCRWCSLARLNGPAFIKWQREMKGKVCKKVIRLCQACFIGIEEGSHHKCSASTLEAVKNLANNLDNDFHDKLAHEILDRQKPGNGPVLLPQARGGKPVHLQVGQAAASVPSQPKFTHQDLLSMASSAHLTGKQVKSVAADLRVKLGRAVVQPGFDKTVIEHNNMYSEFFRQGKKMFFDTEGNVIEEGVIWCNDAEGFLNLIARKRGKELEDCHLKIGGDTGKGFLKITASIFTESEVQQNRKKRRTREEGIHGGSRFEETGQRMVLLLFLVKGVPETMENLDIIFNMLNLESLEYTITGDFKFLMPCFGLLSCNAVHPCLYCNGERRKGKWITRQDAVRELRTFGGIEANTSGWIEAGSKKSTMWTSKFESCVGRVTVWGKGDTPEKTVLDKCAPPSVHSLLALNSVLRPHMEKIWEGDLWSFLREEINVIPHSYQGKDGAFEGPQCNKILNSVEHKLSY